MSNAHVLVSNLCFDVPLSARLFNASAVFETARLGVFDQLESARTDESKNSMPRSTVECSWQPTLPRLMTTKAVSGTDAKKLSSDA